MSKVLFDHIAMAIPRMADAPAVLAGVLGGVPTDGASSPVFNWGVWRFEGGGDLEILEPRGTDGFVHRFLAARGPGIHHVTFKVPSLQEACERAEARGYTIVGRDELRGRVSDALHDWLRRHHGLTITGQAPAAAPPDPTKYLRALLARTAFIDIRGLQCVEVLLGRGVHLQAADEERVRSFCLAAIEREAPLRERHALGLTLGRFGDSRVVIDLRDRAAYVEITAGDYGLGDERKRFTSFRSRSAPTRYQASIEGTAKPTATFSDPGTERAGNCRRDVRAMTLSSQSRHPSWHTAAVSVSR